MPEEKAFRISQHLNPLSKKTLSIVLKATTKEAKLASAIKLEFQVSLTPRIDTGITVEPSLSTAYEIPFSSTYAQLFKFSSKAG